MIIETWIISKQFSLSLTCKISPGMTDRKISFKLDRHNMWYWEIIVFAYNIHFEENYSIARISSDSFLGKI